MDSVKKLEVTTDGNLKYLFRTEQIELFESHEAAELIRAHPKCPFTQFAFTGEAEIDRKWHYIAGNGPMQEPLTQIILLEK